MEFHTIIVIAIGGLIGIYPDIRLYFWNKKSDAQKYAEYRKFVNEWNGTNYH